MLKRLTRTAAFLTVSFLMLASQANAQDWSKVYQFPAADGWINVSYFFNQQVGLIGFEWNQPTNNGMVKRTIDGGKTWTDCTVPVLNNAAPIVKDIWFKDQDTGWMVVGGNLNISDERLWRSTDGGQTWTVLLNEPAFTGPVSVRQTGNALTVTEPLGVGIWTSTDEGITWTQHSSKKNGLEFEDNLNGVATEYRFGDNSTSFLYTTDGGLNWLSSPGGIQHEAFGVYAVKHGQIFVAAPEDTLAAPSPVLRSTDNGKYWNQVFLLPMQTTGGVAGVYGVIYVQNSGANVPNAPQGLMRSIDSGKTWISVGGPNQNGGNTTFAITDTRFSVTGCGDIVYASDGVGGLWKTVDGGDSTRTIPQCNFVDTDKFGPAITVICDTLRNLYYLHNDHPNPGPIDIQSIAIYDTLGRPDTTGAVFIDSLPPSYYPIGIGDSVAFGLGWHPGAMMDSAASDFVTIQVIFQVTYFQPGWGLNPFDTIYLRVNLGGLSTPADYALSLKTISKIGIPVCNAVDTTLQLINKGCDSLAITSAQLAKNNWILTDAGGNPVTPPIHLGPGDTLLFRLRATPTSTTVLSDSLEVAMHYMGRDTSFGVGMHTSVKIDPSHPWLATTPAIDFGSLATCDSTESPLTLSNTGCDTITITKTDLTDSHFELLDTNGNPLPLPLIIPTDSIRRVVIRFIPKNLGANNTTIRFHYQYSKYGFDSSNVAGLSGTGVGSGTVTYVPGTLDFGTVSVCSLDSEAITFRNSSCGQSAFIDSLIVPAPFVLSDPSVNISGKVIPPGGSLVVYIRYKPTAKGVVSGTGTFVYSLNNGNTLVDSSFLLTGTGGPGSSVFETVPPLTPNMFAFPTISQCDRPDSVSFAIVNTGCDSLAVTGLLLDPSLTSALGISENRTIPTSLGSGDTLHVTVAIMNLIVGTYNGNMHIRYTLADGTTVDSSIGVSSTITAGSGSSTLSMTTPATMDFNNIQSCAKPDTAIVLSYQGCGTITVQLNLTGTGFSIEGGVTSLQLSPGETVTIRVAYDGTTTGNLNGTLNIQSNAATNPNYTVQFSGTVQPAETVHFKVGFSTMPVVAGQVFNATLTPDIAFSGKGLQTIHGVYEYRSNNFNVGPGTLTSSIPGLVQNGPTKVGTTEQYTFDITGNNLTLDPTKPLVSLPMEAMISDSVGGTVQVNSIALNGGDVAFNNCVLTSTTQSLNASISIQCGDSLLISVLNGKPIVLSEQPRPNPVTEETGFQTTLNLIVAENGIAEITLYNALGEQLTHDYVPLASGGTVPYTFNLADHPAGSYYYSVHFTSASALSGTLRGTFLLLK